jgi:hypothetical protein
MSLELPYGPGSQDLLLLRPLGMSVTGAGCEVQVPGRGRVDLHQISDPGDEIGLGHFEVTGSHARTLISKLLSDAPDLHERFDGGAGAIVFMNVGDGARSGLLHIASQDVELFGQLGDLARDVLQFRGGPALRTARCRQHNLPEICPRQH